MESNCGSASHNAALSTTVTCAAATSTPVTVSRVTSPATGNASNNSSLLLAGGSSNSTSVVAVLPTSCTLKPTQAQFETKQEEANLSLASTASESQRSLSGAPSASSSPTQSPQGKIFGRNANGTMVTTSRPGNEAEVQLYRLLQRASLLSYYDTLLEMGGDDVQQLYEAGEEEFLEIMALVGMASKPLHVRRLQKALHEWANNPALFQGPMASGFYDTPLKTVPMCIPETAISSRTKFSSAIHAFQPTPLVSTVQTVSTHSLPYLTTSNALVAGVTLPQAALPLPTACSGPPASHSQHQLHSSGVTHQVTSSSPQLTPVLTDLQVARITLGAEKIAGQLPQREPRAQTSKKRTSRELEQVMAMGENDPRRMDEIRKYSAIYGRFDCKRRPEKPLTLHEVCVNEAAAQLCRLVPALLTRRDELFPLARQIVKDAGFGHSASIARYGGLMPQVPAQQSPRSTAAMGDCESSDTSPVTLKRVRLSSNDAATSQDCNRDTLYDSRFNLFAMYQKFAKPPFDLTDITRLPLVKSDYDDNDSRFSFSSSSSPSMAQNIGSDHEREFADGGLTLVADSATKSPHSQNVLLQSQTATNSDHTLGEDRTIDTIATTSSSLSGVHVISAAGGNIIAVANPDLALSPTFNDSIKREVGSQDN